MERIELIKELTTGYSSQTRTSNKYWLLLILASILSFVKYSKPTEDLSLPFSLGHVSQTDYYTFLLLMICITTIAYASAWLQQLRSRNLIQQLIDKTPESELYIHEVHIQDYFDATSSQTFNRVAPIVQVLRRRDFFCLNETYIGKKNRLLRAIIYGTLKLLAISIIYIIPLLALYKNVVFFSKNTVLNPWEIPTFIYWIMITITSSVFLALLYSEIKYACNSIRKIMMK